MSELQYKDLSEAELDYECRDFRRAAYAQWIAFREKRETKHKAEERWQAKKDRNFAKADELRAKLSALGYNILDTREGYQIQKI